MFVERAVPSASGWIDGVVVETNARLVHRQNVAAVVAEAWRPGEPFWADRRRRDRQRWERLIDLWTSGILLSRSADRERRGSELRLIRRLRRDRRERRDWIEGVLALKNSACDVV